MPVQFDQQAGGFRIEGQLVSGVLPLLKKLLYPRFRYKESTHRNRAPPVAPPASTTAHLTARQPAQRDPRGRAAGVALDAAIAQGTRLLQQHQLPVSALFRSRQRPLPKPLVRYRTRWSKPVQNFWRLCVARHWTPVQCQAPVGSLELRCATHVDVVCQDQNQDYIVLEIKLGYCGTTLTDSTRAMSKPFTDRSDCYNNQHQLQLLLNTQLYRITHPNHRIAGAFVLRFHEDGVDASPLADWAKQRWKQLRQLIQARP